jgi:hypothetical protein
MLKTLQENWPIVALLVIIVVLIVLLRKMIAGSLKWLGRQVWDGDVTQVAQMRDPNQAVLATAGTVGVMAKRVEFMVRLARMAVVLLLVCVAIGSVSLYASYKGWSKGNLNLRATRHLMDAVTEIDCTPPSAPSAATLIPPKSAEQSDRCKECNADAEYFEGKPLLLKLDSGYAFFEGSCTGQGFCTACRPAALKTQSPPQPVCRHYTE